MWTPREGRENGLEGGGAQNLARTGAPELRFGRAWVPHARVGRRLKSFRSDMSNGVVGLELPLGLIGGISGNGRSDGGHTEGINSGRSLLMRPVARGRTGGGGMAGTGWRANGAEGTCSYVQHILPRHSPLTGGPIE